MTPQSLKYMQIHQDTTRIWEQTKVEYPGEEPQLIYAIDESDVAVQSTDVAV